MASRAQTQEKERKAKPFAQREILSTEDVLAFYSYNTFRHYFLIALLFDSSII
jgi:hypothetical protein